MNYKLNEHSMFENPERIVWRTKHGFAAILLAEHNGFWYGGEEFLLPGAGGGSLPGMNEYRKGFKTKEDCYNARFVRCIENLERFINDAYSTQQVRTAKRLWNLLMQQARATKRLWNLLIQPELF